MIAALKSLFVKEQPKETPKPTEASLLPSNLDNDLQKIRELTFAALKSRIDVSYNSVLQFMIQAAQKGSESCSIAIEESAIRYPVRDMLVAKGFEVVERGASLYIKWQKGQNNENVGS